MKKYLYSFISLLIITVFFMVGCTNPGMPKTVGERLEYNLNALQNVIKSLDTLDNNYLINPDISPSTTTTSNTLSIYSGLPNSTEKSEIIFTNGFMLSAESATNSNINDKILESNKQKNIANNNIDTVILQNENNNIEQNNFEDGESNEEEKERMFSESDISLVNEDDIFSNKNIVDNKLENNNSDENQQEQEKEKVNKVNVVEDNRNIKKKISTYENEEKINVKNTNNNTENTDADVRYNDNDETLKKDGIEPIKHVSEKEFYNARFIADNVNVKNPAMDNYIDKIQKLYAMTNDSVEANNEFESKKNNINLMIDDLRNVAIQLKKGEFEPNRQQIIAINNYIGDIRTTISRLRGVNGQLNNEINKINNAERNGMTTSIDVLNSNYIRILNHIDVRITYLKNAISTLEEIKDLLYEAQFGNYIDNDFELELYNNNENYIHKESGYNNSDYENINNNENDLNRSIGINNNRENRDNNINSFNNENNANNPQLNNFGSDINYNNYDNLINIDTYSRANKENSNRELQKYYSRRNIDTFNNTRIKNSNNNNSNLTKLNNVKNNKNYINNTNQNQSNNNIDNNLNNNNFNSNDLSNNNFANQGYNNLDNNNIGFNNRGGFRNDGYYRNIYQNDRITQNNINPGFRNRNLNNRNNPGFNNSGNNMGYGNNIAEYGENNMNYGANNMGGVSGDGVINNRSNARSTVADEHGNVYREGKLIKNTDTYKQSTLIDIINQGTVNNGINTLSLQNENIKENADLGLNRNENDVKETLNENIITETNNSVLTENNELNSIDNILDSNINNEDKTELINENIKSDLETENLLEINSKTISDIKEEPLVSASTDLEKNKLISNLFTSDINFEFV